MIPEDEEGKAPVHLQPISTEGDEDALFSRKFQIELSQSFGERGYEGFGFVAVWERAHEVIDIFHHHRLSARCRTAFLFKPQAKTSCR